MQTFSQAIVPSPSHTFNFDHAIDSPEEANKGRREGRRQRQVFDEICNSRDDLIRLVESPKLANQLVKGNFGDIAQVSQPIYEPVHAFKLVEQFQIAGRRRTNGNADSPAIIGPSTVR